MNCKTQCSKLKAQRSLFKVFHLNKAQGLKRKQQGFTKSRDDGLSGAYVAAGSTTWLVGSEFDLYINVRHSRK